MLYSLMQGQIDALDLENSNLESTVDVRRVYTDSSTQAVLVGSNNGRTTRTKTATIRIQDGTMGHLQIAPATYQSGSWVSATVSFIPETVKLNYVAGIRHKSVQMKTAVIKLAHTLMQHRPCGCDMLGDRWEEDRRMPEIVTPERLNCPFGPYNCGGNRRKCWP